jgi:hypothetical protein
MSEYNVGKPPEDIARRAKRTYKEQYPPALRALNEGKFVAVDVIDELVFLADTPDEAMKNARQASPDGEFYLIEVRAESLLQPIVGVLVGILIALSLGYLAFYLVIPHSERHSPEIRVEKVIRMGDAAFERYRYDEALGHYSMAQEELSKLTDFEAASPSKDVRLLQHYYNTAAVLRSRIELILTARDIVRLRSVRR